VAKILDKTARTAMGLAIRIKGNVGVITWRTFNKNKTIAYRERVRTSALTPKQQAHQVRFKRGYEQWRSLTDDQRHDWRRAADRASTRQIAAHLFLRVWWVQDTWFLDQINRHYHITLTLPGP